jgi:two-component system sensor histidine kinase TctE
MTQTLSIGRRLTLLLAAIAALLALLSWGMVSSFSGQAAARTQDNVLAASVATIAETLRSEQGMVRLELPYSAFAMLGAIGEDRVFYRVSVAGETLTGYDDLRGGHTPESPGVVLFDTLDYRGETVRMASVSRVVLAGLESVPVTVSVAQTRNGIAAVTAGLSRTAALLSVAFFLLAAALSAIAARASLRPLNEIAQSVSRRGPSDLRPIRRPAPSELAPLITSLNRLMDRLGQSIRRSEDFITEAAHRVRTPLATVRAQAEIALHTVTGEDEKKSLRRVIRAVDESSRSASQLLDHATVAFRAEDLERKELDMSDLTKAVVESLSPTAEMKDITFALDDAPAPIRGDAILLQTALRNVLDNAIKYSPPDTTVHIHVQPLGNTVQVEVCDQGKGLGLGPVGHLTERFRRGDNVEGVVGSGLGLTIADEVMRAHDGSLVLRNIVEKGTGTCVLLVLPLA